MQHERLYCIEIVMADGEDIDRDFWIRAIKQDSELDSVKEIIGLNPMTGGEMKIPLDEPAACWNAHPHGYTNPPFIFSYEDGAISAFNVDKPFVDKACQIAIGLGAVIVETEY